MRPTDSVPFKEFVTLLSEGVTNPRPVARAVIETRPDRGERFMMVGLSVVMQAMVLAVFSLVAVGANAGFAGLLQLGVIEVVRYVLTATIAYNLGARMGGRGSPEAVATAVAWHAILMAALAPLQAGVLGGGVAGVVMLFLFAGLYIWLLGACIAEAHQFKSTGRVAGAVLGFTIVLGLLLSPFLPGMPTP